MCLGIPGKIVSVLDESGDLIKQGIVDFGGICKTICLSYTPEAKIGDYVIVHVGFAISIINEQAAELLLNTLKQLAEINDEIPN